MKVAGKITSLATPLVMGIINVTKDSFYEGSRASNEAMLLGKAEQMFQDGADVLDIGAYSSRPGADDIPLETELNDVTSAIKALSRNFPQAVLSVDTFRSQVARAAVEEGAHIINDISGGDLDKQMYATVAALKVPYVMMHMRGTPQTMKDLAQYEDISGELIDHFRKKVFILQKSGVEDIILDPGFGFAKSVSQNFELLKHLERFKILELPIMVGLSRKSMIYKTLNIPVEEALNGTTALHMYALMAGASILRAHDVKEAVQTIKLFKAINP